MNLQSLQVKAGRKGAADDLEVLFPESNMLMFEKIEDLVNNPPLTERDHDNWVEANRDQTELAEMILKVADQPEDAEWISITADCLDSLGLCFYAYITSEQGRFRLEEFIPLFPVTSVSSAGGVS